MGASKIASEHFNGVSFTERNPIYKCICSKEYIDSVVISIGKEEIYDILKEQGEIKVECQYCDKKYVYGYDDIDALLSEN
jgi:molecular chaperone Hsp33